MNVLQNELCSCGMFRLTFSYLTRLIINATICIIYDLIGVLIWINYFEMSAVFISFSYNF